MELKFEVPHSLGRKDMAVDALSWLLTRQTDDFDFDENLTANTIADHQDEPDKHDTKNQKLIAIP